MKGARLRSALLACALFALASCGDAGAPANTGSAPTSSSAPSAPPPIAAARHRAATDDETVAGRVDALLAAWSREVDPDVRAFERYRAEWEALGTAAWPRLGELCLIDLRNSDHGRVPPELCRWLRPGDMSAAIAALRDGPSALRALVLRWIGDGGSHDRRIAWPYATDGPALARSLAAALEDPDAAVRAAALRHLAEAGPAADGCGAALVPLLTTDAAESSGAADVVRRLGPYAQDAAPGLIAAMPDADGHRLERLAQLLGSLQRGPDAAADALAAMARTGDAAHRLAAIGVLVSWPDARESLVPAIRAVVLDSDLDGDARLEALRHLAEADPSAARDCVPLLQAPSAIQGILAMDRRFDGWTSAELAAFRAASDPLLRAFGSLLDSTRDSEERRAAAAAALAEATDDDPARRHLAADLVDLVADEFPPTDAQALALLRRGDRSVRDDALRILARNDAPIVGAHADVVATLVQQCPEATYVPRNVRVICRLEGGEMALVASCERVLRTETDATARRQVLPIIAALGSAAASLLPWLTEDELQQVARVARANDAVAAARSWNARDPEASAGDLAASDDARIGAFLRHSECLRDIDARTTAALARESRIVSALRAATRDVGASADDRRSLVRFAPALPDAEALAFLRALADDTDEDVRVGVADCLGEYGGLRKLERERAAALESLLGDSSIAVRVRACQACVRLAPVDGPVLDRLRVACDASDPRLRLAAGSALWMTTHDDTAAWRAVLPALERAADLDDGRLLSVERLAPAWHGLRAPSDSVAVLRAAIVAAGREGVAAGLALHLLEGMGPAAAPALPEIRRALAGAYPTRVPLGGNGAPPYLFAAADCLAAIGPPAVDALPDLRATRLRLLARRNDATAIERAIRAIEAR